MRAILFIMWYVLSCSTSMHYYYFMYIVVDVYHVSLIYFHYVIHVMISLSHNYISSVYSLFPDSFGLPLHNVPSSGVLMKSIGT